MSTTFALLMRTRLRGEGRPIAEPPRHPSGVWVTVAGNRPGAETDQNRRQPKWWVVRLILEATLDESSGTALRHRSDGSRQTIEGFERKLGRAQSRSECGGDRHSKGVWQVADVVPSTRKSISFPSTIPGKGWGL